MAPNTANRMATALLTIMCFLDHEKIHQGLLMLALGLVNAANFPSNVKDYCLAIQFLIANGKVSRIAGPPKVFKIADSIRTAVIQALSMDERLAAFNAAVSLVSAAWPFLTTYNATDVDRFRFIRKHRHHIVAMRNYCRDLAPDGFMPDLKFCSLLHEEAWLEIMQTTVADMRLSCAELGLPLAHQILSYHEYRLTTPARENEWQKLCMNQARFAGITASMLGKEQEATDTLEILQQMIKNRSTARGLPEDSRMLPFAHVESGQHKLRSEYRNESGAFDDFQLAIASVKEQKGDGEQAFKFMLPRILFALFAGHVHRNWKSAIAQLNELMSERGQMPGLIFDDVTSMETGIVLFAMGSVHWFSTPSKSFPVLRKALGFLRRAVSVLKETHGDEAFWTLAATYRLAVCLYDLDQYKEAVEHLDDLNRVFRGYSRPFVNHDGANILWMKARALWKSGMALKALGNPVLELEANGMIEDAVAMYWNISGKPADGESMRDDSWDEMVFFASR